MQQPNWISSSLAKKSSRNEYIQSALLYVLEVGMRGFGYIWPAAAAFDGSFLAF
jgi:hypothetical protein